MKDLPRLLVVTDRRATNGRPLARVVEATLEGGARMVQLRERDLDGGALLGLARELREVTARHGARLLVNDRIDVALAAGADGVVLRARSFPTGAARRLLGKTAWIGRSTHSAWEVAKAAAEGCDFAILGPIFETPSKAAFGSPLGLEALREASRSGIPVLAIGGIDASNAAEVRAAGAYGAAVIRAALGTADPTRAVRDLGSALTP